MAALKPISKAAIPQALTKATRYRLLNEPAQAESICRDVLEADPTNQDALYSLILTLTDQFGSLGGASLSDIMKLTEQLTDPYQGDYARGIVQERYAAVALETHSPHAGYIAFDHLKQAMDHFERAEKVRPQDNEDPILRWNACVRMIELHKLRAAPEEEHRPLMGE